jgi:D-glycero-D-manno-heptose 1,7-bisphosphate phosphatase
MTSERFVEPGEIAVSKFVLLDRDGVINRRIGGGYVTAWEEFVFLPRVLEAICILTQHGFGAIVVSNQAGVGKALMTSSALAEINRHFVKEVEAHGGRIVAVYCCEHRQEDNCQCRKPKPGLLLQAQRDHAFDFAETLLIGDSESDLMAAHAVGCPALLIGDNTRRDGRNSSPSPLATFPGLYEAVRFVLAMKTVRRDWVQAREV